MQSDCKANELRMPFALKFLGSPKLWERSDFASAITCVRLRTSANAERMLNYYWANWYESGAIWQICKRFTFANGYLLKWDRAFRIYLLTCKNLLWDILRLPSSRRAALGLYMSFSRYDEVGVWTSHHTHCCIETRRATHCATGVSKNLY